MVGWCFEHVGGLVLRKKYVLSADIRARAPRILWACDFSMHP